jgi:hypothetical protein
MATRMTTEEIEKQVRSAEQVDTHAYRNEHTEDDYFTAVLYKTKQGRYFRLIDQSGMNSQFSGSGNVGEWLEVSEVSSWKNF